MIPKRFKMFGETIEVIQSSSIESDKDRIGECHCRYNRITITNNELVPEDIKESTFWHEFLHIAFSKLRYTELFENEELVNQLGQLIHQAITTMEG